MCREPSFGAGVNTRCRTCLDELSATSSETSTRTVVRYLCVHGTSYTGPVRTGLGAVYAECGGRTRSKMLTLHKYTHTEKVNQGTLPTLVCDPIWRGFSLENQEKMLALRASCASLLLVHLDGEVLYVPTSLIRFGTSDALVAHPGISACGRSTQSNIL